MNWDEINRLREEGLRRPLTADEEVRLSACFAGDPEARVEWEDDLRLKWALRQLPDAPLSPGFTSEVLRRVERELAEKQAGLWRRGWVRILSLAWRHKWAWATAVVALTAGLTFHEVREQQQEASRRELARSAVAVSRMVTLPPLELLENYEIIQRLDEVPQHVDDELLAVLE